jgi:nucleoside-diphosphate-sugar epimerase
MKVLVTGASGLIGSAFVAASAADGLLDLVRADLIDRDPRSPFPFLHLDVRDLAACRAACHGVAGVLHLAAHRAADSDFRSEVLPTNIVGTYNIAAAAVEAGVERFVFASSAQAVEGYPLERQVRAEDAPWPANDYGVGKAFGEALCGSLARRSSTTFVSVRIANYESEPPGADASLRDRAAWLSPRDAIQLLTRALTQPVVEHVVVNGVSDNATKRLDLSTTRETLGYAPADDAFRSRPL